MVDQPQNTSLPFQAYSGGNTVWHILPLYVWLLYLCKGIRKGRGRGVSHKVLGAQQIYLHTECLASSALQLLVVEQIVIYYQHLPCLKVGQILLSYMCTTSKEGSGNQTVHLYDVLAPWSMRVPRHVHVLDTFQCYDRMVHARLVLSKSNTVLSLSKS